MKEGAQQKPEEPPSYACLKLLIGRIVSYISGCCFKPQSFGAVCFEAADNCHPFTKTQLSANRAAWYGDTEVTTLWSVLFKGTASMPNGKLDRQTNDHNLASYAISQSNLGNPFGGNSSTSSVKRPPFSGVSSQTSHNSVIQTSGCFSGHSARSSEDYPVLFISIMGSP